MATSSGGQIYATLLLTDSYLPGALVLAHSLRDAQATRKMAVLVTTDSVSPEAIVQLQTVYDYVIPVPRIRNDHPNLYLMDRADLHSAFTKINLWKLTQFSKIVYIDADVVAYRAPEELFNLDASFSAAPDIGWPDLFNTGVMVLTPNMGDYYAMIAMSERGISFDGADQGLINMHFKNSYNRLSFTYNVTPSAHYQYRPAYRHFQSSINMVHFIGSNKPWFSGRNAPHGDSPYDEMVGRWWAVYDRHYRAQENGAPVSELVQYLTKGEFDPYSKSTGEQETQPGEEQRQGHDDDLTPSTPLNLSVGELPKTQTKTETVNRQIAMQSWDPQRESPPVGSKPEAENFPSTHYTMSRDTNPFIAPERYPSPPKNMYHVPGANPPNPIFPWETHRPRPSRSFAGDAPPPPIQPAEPSTPTQRSRSSTLDEGRSEPSTPTTPTYKDSPSDPWNSFTRTNAWDDVPEIERFVSKHRRGKSGASIGTVKSPAVSAKASRENLRSQGLKLTDFPSEVERPSLPVTPAPVHRGAFWAGDESGENPNENNGMALPAAEGVPLQTDWDPAAQLTKLAQQQSELLLQKLGKTKDSESTSGSEVLSPQPVKGGATTSKLRSMASAADEASTAT